MSGFCRFRYSVNVGIYGSGSWGCREFEVFRNFVDFVFFFIRDFEAFKIFNFRDFIIRDFWAFGILWRSWFFAVEILCYCGFRYFFFRDFQAFKIFNCRNFIIRDFCAFEIFEPSGFFQSGLRVIKKNPTLFSLNTDSTISPLQENPAC